MVEVFEANRLLEIGNRLGEGTRWNVAEQALYWVDIENHRFSRMEAAAGEIETFDVGLPVGALAFRKGGGLVLATKKGFATWDFGSNKPEFLPGADPEKGKERARFNDGRVDCMGRFWAGTMVPGEHSSSLYRLDPDGSVQKMDSGFTISNGIGWSPDNKIMYFTDTEIRTIYAYDFDPAAGSISNRRPFVHTPDDDSYPDGLSVDSEGFVWCARWGGFCVVRYDPEGKQERIVRLPAENVTCVALGGPDLTDLYISTAWSGLSDSQRQAQPAAGDMFYLKTDIKGMEEFHFGG